MDGLEKLYREAVCPIDWDLGCEDVAEEEVVLIEADEEIPLATG